MAVDNPRTRARQELEELGLSMETASYLVDDRPPGGWASFATKDDLRVLAAELRAEMAELRAEMERGFKKQTWQLAKLVLGAQGIVVVVIAGIGAVLRFA